MFPEMPFEILKTAEGKALNKIFLKAFSKSKKNRYLSVNKLVEDLKQIDTPETSIFFNGEYTPPKNEKVDVFTSVLGEDIMSKLDDIKLKDYKVKGGHLIIGVHDSGNITGIARDNFPNEDKFYLHFASLVTSSLGAEQMFFMEPKFEELHGEKVFTIECQPSSAPVYLKFENKEHFFIRAGAGTRELAVSEVQSFINNRFIS